MRKWRKIDFFVTTLRADSVVSPATCRAKRLCDSSQWLLEANHPAIGVSCVFWIRRQQHYGQF